MSIPWIPIGLGAIPNSERNFVIPARGCQSISALCSSNSMVCRHFAELRCVTHDPYLLRVVGHTVAPLTRYCSGLLGCLPSSRNFSGCSAQGPSTHLSDYPTNQELATNEELFDP